MEFVKAWRLPPHVTQTQHINTGFHHNWSRGSTKYLLLTQCERRLSAVVLNSCRCSAIEVVINSDDGHSITDINRYNENGLLTSKKKKKKHSLGSQNKTNKKNPENSRSQLVGRIRGETKLPVSKSAHHVL